MNLNTLPFSDRACVARLVMEILAPQELMRLAITVNDGEEDTLHKSTDMVDVLESMASTDEDYLIIHEQWSDGTWQRLGGFWLIYANGSEHDPMVCISDCFYSEQGERVINGIYDRVSRHFEFEEEEDESEFSGRDRINFEKVVTGVEW